MGKTGSFSLYARLNAMMFFQYFLFAVWWVPLAAYLAGMGLSRNLTALILSSMAFGSIVSPMVGMLADRYFKAQHVLAVSNVVVAIMLVFAGSTSQPFWLFIFLLVAMLFYMPTWALVSAIAMRNAPSDLFPRIRVFGTIGWVLAGIFSVISVGWFNRDFDATSAPFFVGATLSILAALVNLSLPDTPPRGKGQKTSFIDIMGFRSFSMLRDRNFAVFLVILFFSMLPFAMYWSYFSEYLASSGYKLITVTMSVGQVLEVLILITVPFFIRKIGLRNTMIIGQVALVVRYVALYSAGEEASLPLVLIGAGVHGIIFGYHHLGAQIYTDKKAPDHLKSQAQGLLFFVTFALGLLAGNFVCGWIIKLYSQETAAGMVYQWDNIWGVTAIMSAMVLLAFLMFFRKDNYQRINL